MHEEGFRRIYEKSPNPSPFFYNTPKQGKSYYKPSPPKPTIQKHPKGMLNQQGKG